MKSLLFLLLLVGCSKPHQISTLGFSAAYVSPACMGQEPNEVTLVFDGQTVVIPVKEVKTGIVSISPVEVVPGQYELTDVYVTNKSGEIISYYEHGFHESGIVVVCIIKGAMYDLEGENTIYGQLFCDSFWGN